jgi:hypothetical protein
MLKKYLSKFTVDILPSVFATVVGAYIVNYYIIPKAREDRPPAPAAAQSAPAPDKAAAKPAEAAAVDASEPTPSPTKKAADKPVEKTVTEKSDKPETAKIDTTKAAESRRHAPAREKAVAKAEPSKVESVAVAPAPTPVLATVGTAPSGDANDLARAAIERLSRGEKVEAPRAPEAPRTPERTASAQPQTAPVVLQPPVQQAQPMQQLPPPIIVSTPNIENSQAADRVEQPRGPRPPGSVPVPMRGDMQANADDRGGRTNVVEDVLSGAKSMFDKVIPRSFER